MDDQVSTFFGNVRDANEGKIKKKQDLDEPFATWQKTREPADLMRVVEQHRADIDGAVNALVKKPSKLIRNRADLMAAEAIQNYDPTKKVPMRNWLQSQLRPIARHNRSVVEFVSLPEQARREMAQLKAAREQFWLDNDREPDEEDLADLTGIPVRKQMKLQRRERSQLATGSLENTGGGDEDGDGILDAGVEEADPIEEAQDYLYYDMDQIDRFIYRHRTGYRGAKILPNIEIAEKLNISPAAVTKRMSGITRQLESMLDE